MLNRKQNIKAYKSNEPTSVHTFLFYISTTCNLCHFDT